MPTPYLVDREPAMIRTFVNEFDSAEEWGESRPVIDFVLLSALR